MSLRTISPSTCCAMTANSTLNLGIDASRLDRFLYDILLKNELMSEKLVTVATFSTPTEASIVRNQLEADGVRTFLTDDATVGMAWHLGTAVGGIKLQVGDDDFERALSILEVKRIEIYPEAGCVGIDLALNLPLSWYANSKVLKRLTGCLG